eukprot:PhM_4_TR14121/c2_g1_i1/m.91067
MGSLLDPFLGNVICLWGTFSLMFIFVTSQIRLVFCCLALYTLFLFFLIFLSFMCFFLLLLYLMNLLFVFIFLVCFRRTRFCMCHCLILRYDVTARLRRRVTRAAHSTATVVAEQRRALLLAQHAGLERVLLRRALDAGLDLVIVRPHPPVVHLLELCPEVTCCRRTHNLDGVLARDVPGVHAHRGVELGDLRLLVLEQLRLHVRREARGELEEPRQTLLDEALDVVVHEVEVEHVDGQAVEQLLQVRVGLEAALLEVSVNVGLNLLQHEVPHKCVCGEADGLGGPVAGDVFLVHLAHDLGRLLLAHRHQQDTAEVRHGLAVRVLLLPQ